MVLVFGVLSIGNSASIYYCRGEHSGLSLNEYLRTGDNPSGLIIFSIFGVVYGLILARYFYTPPLKGGHGLMIVEKEKKLY
jgi:hypothetical protein